MTLPTSEPRPALANDLDAVAEALFEATAAEIRSRPARIPTATYRLQFGPAMTFRDAAALVPYLRDLGVDTLYASPFLRARTGSQHGYDVVDHTALHEAVGTREDLEALVRALNDHGMTLLIDMVPNHMGVGRDNAFWLDLLENGPSSLYAPFFDVDWFPVKPELQGKILLPILGDRYGKVLEGGQLRLRYNDGAFAVDYYEQVLPLNPKTYQRILQPVVAPLAARLGEEHEAVLELQSILTGLDHLPPGTETRRARVVERRREKEILRKRLASVVAATPELAEELDRAVQRLNGTPDQPASFDDLEALLNAQGFRPAYWRVAAEEINYRRFFDMSDLAAIRVEHPEVFAHVHRLVLELVRSGAAAGLRIDHPDGLWDPVGYLEQLQREAFLAVAWRQLRAELGDDAAATAQIERLRPRLMERLAREAVDPRGPLSRPMYLIVEKILTRGETLPEDWPVHGTVGYEVAAVVTGVLVDPAGEAPLTAAWQRFTGLDAGFEALVHSTKQLILRTSMAAELHVLGHRLSRLAERDRHSRDLTLGSLTEALSDVVASFPVYRTYVRESTEAMAEQDRDAMMRALRVAAQRRSQADPSLLAFVRAVLLLEVPPSVQGEDRAAWRHFVMKLQQLTGPVMARAVEDTAFYVFNRLLALCEVGGEPERFGCTLQVFHRAQAERQRLWPDGLSASSTHDTKRSEDVRARIAVLSELPAWWEQAVAELAEAAAPARVEVDGRKAPDRNEEWLLYQTLAGMWPVGLDGRDAEGLAQATERVCAYMVKACREAKINTSWFDPRTDWVDGVQAFVRTILRPDSEFLARLLPRVEVVAWHGLWAGLAQLVLKLAGPGVPDFYQGTERWHLALVDPDNRRPVDHQRARQALAELKDQANAGDLAPSLLADPFDDKLKLLVTWQGLQLRARRPECFGSQGAYVPLAAQGLHADHVVAFARRGPTAEVVAIVPRWTAKLLDGRRDLPIGEVWADTTVVLAEGRYRDAFTGQNVEVRDGRLAVRDVLGRFVVALLERVDGAKAT